MDAESEPIPALSLTQFHPGHILFTLIPPHLYLGDSETCRLALAAQIRAFRVGRKFQRIIIRGGRSAHRRRAGLSRMSPFKFMPAQMNYRYSSLSCALVNVYIEKTVS